MGAWQDSVRSVTSSFTRREGGIVGGGGRRRTRRNQSNEIRRGRRRNERSVTNAIPNIDFDFPDDEQTKLLRNENYHQVGETLKNITKRGEVSFNFPTNILDSGSGDKDANSKNSNSTAPEIPLESLSEIGFALGLSVFSGFWALWEAFGKKAVFGDEEEEEDRIEEDDRYDNDILKIRRKRAKRIRERHIIQGVDVTSFPIFKDEVVLKAVKFAEEKHKGQTRKTGEPYVTHLVETARILATALPEPRDQNKFGSATQEKLRETISACLLVATLDDPNSKSSNLLRGETNKKMVLELRENFGNATAELVLQAARMGKVMAGVRRRQRRKRRDNNTNNRSEEEIDDNKKLEELLLDVVKDPRVFLIKIAERLHNMRTLYTLDPQKAETVADETLRVWCSFAQKLGIWTVKSELEDMCFAVLEPERFEEIVRSRDEFWLQESKRGRFRGKNFKGTIAPELQEQNEKQKAEKETFTFKTERVNTNYMMMDVLDEMEKDPSWTRLSETQRALRRRLQCVQPFEALTTRDNVAMRIDEKVLRESPMRPATEKSLEALAQWQNKMFQALRLDGVVLNVNVRMSSRLKSLFSTSEKMKRKNVPFSEVYDGRATRIIIGDPVPSAPRIASGEGGDESELFDKDKIDSGLPSEIEACYALLNAVHKIYRPIHGEYDDYITKPKKSGYKSLHTAVVGDDGKPLEVQIRTRGMHDAAEWGVAAHWLYKTRTENKSSKHSSKKKKNEVDEREKDPTPQPGQVVQLISPTSRAGGGVVVGVESAGRCTVAKPTSSRRSAMMPDATEWALDFNGHEDLLREVQKKQLKSARQETKQYYILEFCLYKDGRWHERDQLGKAGRITMEPLDIFAKLDDEKSGSKIENRDKKKVKKRTPDRRYERMMKKWQKANAPLGIIRSQGLRDEFDKKMSNRDKEAYLSGTPGWDQALARSQPPAASTPPSSSHEAQFTRAEAAQLEAELALSTKRNGKSETLQSATVDLTSKGLLVVTWDESNPALKIFSPGTTAGTVRRQMALEASSDDKKKARKAFVDSKYVNVNSVMVSADTQLQDADCVFLDDLAVY